VVQSFGDEIKKVFRRRRQNHAEDDVESSRGRVPGRPPQAVRQRKRIFRTRQARRSPLRPGCSGHDRTSSWDLPRSSRIRIFVNFRRHSQPDSGRLCRLHLVLLLPAEPAGDDLRGADDDDAPGQRFRPQARVATLAGKAPPRPTPIFRSQCHKNVFYSSPTATQNKLERSSSASRDQRSSLFNRPVADEK